MTPDPKKTKTPFIKGVEYGLKYSKTVATRAHRGTDIPSEWAKINIIGIYEYIGNRGSKLHFYDNCAGIDVLISKSDAIQYSINYDIAKKNIIK